MPFGPLVEKFCGNTFEKNNTSSLRTSKDIMTINLNEGLRETLIVVP